MLNASRYFPRKELVLFPEVLNSSLLLRFKGLFSLHFQQNYHFTWIIKSCVKQAFRKENIQFNIAIFLFSRNCKFFSSRNCECYTDVFFPHNTVFLIYFRVFLTNWLVFSEKSPFFYRNKSTQPVANLWKIGPPDNFQLCENLSSL